MAMDPVSVINKTVKFLRSTIPTSAQILDSVPRTVGPGPTPKTSIKS